MIWEHKKVMLERIMALETSLQIGEKCSTEYKSVVEGANTMRMLYASYQHEAKRFPFAGYSKKAVGSVLS